MRRGNNWERINRFDCYPAGICKIEKLYYSAMRRLKGYIEADETMMELNRGFFYDSNIIPKRREE